MTLPAPTLWQAILAFGLCWLIGAFYFRRLGEVGLKRWDYGFIAVTAIAAAAGFLTLASDQTAEVTQAATDRVGEDASRISYSVKEGAKRFCDMTGYPVPGQPVKRGTHIQERDSCQWFDEANAAIGALHFAYTSPGVAVAFDLPRARRIGPQAARPIAALKIANATMRNDARTALSPVDRTYANSMRQFWTSVFLWFAAVGGGLRMGKQSAEVARARRATQAAVKDAGDPPRKDGDERWSTRVREFVYAYFGVGIEPSPNATAEDREKATEILDTHLRVRNSAVAMMLLREVKEQADRRRTGQRTTEAKATSIIGFATAVAVFSSQFNNQRILQIQWHGAPVALLGIGLEFVAILSGVLVMLPQSAYIPNAAVFNTNDLVENPQAEARIAFALTENWSMYEKQLQAGSASKSARLDVALWSFILGVIATVVLTVVVSISK